MAGVFEQYAEEHAHRKRPRVDIAEHEENLSNRVEIPIDIDLPGINEDSQTVEDVPVEDLQMDEPASEPFVGPRSRTGRIYRKTWKLLELLPDPPAPVTLSPVPPESNATDSDATPPPTIFEEYIWNPFKTLRNAFGLYREYPSEPSHNPDDDVSLANLVDFDQSSNMPGSNAPSSFELPIHPSTTPSPSIFRNSSIGGIMSWMWSGSMLKSLGEVDRLINFLQSDEFHKEEIMDFDIRTETTRLDEALEAEEEETASPYGRDSWREVDVPIKVPYGKNASLDDIPVFNVPGLHTRKLVEVLKTA
ncbi:hypothetical protein H0H93_006631, partial [Arthromyces matolae]